MSRTSSGAAIATLGAPQAGGSMRWLFVPIGIGIIVGFQSITALPFLVGALQDGRALSPRAVGLVGGIELGAMALAVLGLAPLVHRVPRHHAAFAAALVLAAAQAASAFTENWLWFCLVRALAGAAGGIIAAILNASTSLSPHPERTAGYAMGLATFTDLALFLGLGWAIGEAGAHGAYMLLAAMTLALAPAMLWFPPHTPATPPLTPRVRRAGMLIWMAIACYAAGQTAIWSYVERIGSAVNLSGSFIALSLGLGGMVGVVGALTASQLGQRFGTFWPVLVSTVMLVATAWGLIFAASAREFLLIYCTFVFFYLFKEPFLWGLAARLDGQGRIIAAGSGIGLLGVAAGAALAGQGVQRTDDFTILGWLLLGLIAAGFVLLVPLMRPRAEE